MNTGTLPIGTILQSPQESYRVEAVLGRGGFGITYKVSTEKNVQIGNVTQTVQLFFAVKEFFIKGCDRGDNGQTMTFASTLEGDIKQSREDFLVEARRLNKLGKLSQHIVKVNEVFEANDTAYYVMEYLDGGSVEDYVAQRGPLSWDEARSILAPVADAVELLHKERLLHMDIKPDNIVLKHEKGEVIPVLIDFGIAKHFDSKGRPTSHLAAKGASDGYAPAEQYADITSFAPEIDVYALGATLLFMLTGQRPPKAFDVRSVDDLTSALPTSAGPLAAELLTQAMQGRHFERLKSAKEFADALRKDIPATGSGNDDGGNGTKALKPSKGKPFYKRPLFFGILAVMLAIGLTIVCMLLFKGHSKHTSLDDEDEDDEEEIVEETYPEDSVAMPEDSVAFEVPPADSPSESELTNSQIHPSHPISTTTTTTTSTSGTLNYSYGTYTGELRNGKPNGQGTLTFTTSHVIDSRDPSYVASSGDRVVGSFSNGHLSFGKWHKAAGGDETIVIGE